MMCAARRLIFFGLSSQHDGWYQDPVVWEQNFTSVLQH